MTDPEPPRVDRWLAVLLALIAFVVYGTYGGATELLHDDAIFAYGGQQMLRGVPPYVSIFDHKGPLTSMLCALGAWLGELAGVDSLRAIRATFLTIGVAAVVAVFYLARGTLRSRRAALFAGAMFLAFTRFGYHAAGGPRPKTAAVLFEALALGLAAHQRWYWAAFAGALAGLVWQPTAAFAFVVLVLSVTQAPAGRRLRSLGLALCGMLTPLVSCSAYFLSKGAFGAFFEGAVTFNLRYLESSAGLRRNLFEIGEALFVSNTALGFPTLIGLCAIPLLFLARARHGGPRQALLGDRASALFLALPFPLLWSLADFQGAPDFFVFLPFAAVGFGWVLAHALGSLAHELELRARGRALLDALPVAAFAAGTLFVARYFETPGLREQRAEVAAIFASAAPDATWVSLGAPQAMVLGGRRDPTRYGFLMRGIDRLIEDREPGGFAGWLESLGEPDGVLVGRVVLRSIEPRHLQQLEQWLGRFELDEQASDSWLVYRARGAQPGS